MAMAQFDTFLWHIRKLAAGRGSSRRSDAELLEEFSARSDQTAFAALLARHGPMVLRLCRRVLHHEQDAEDAFQATFLLLARNAALIRKREALAAWLHGVAYRTAMEAKRKAARRRKHEARLGPLLPKTMPSPTWGDIKVVLDEEIQRLPQTLRAAFVLCVLEGKCGPEAAAELGVKLGTLSSRLTQARKRLQQRLIRRGIELSAFLAALAVADTASKAAVPAGLATATLRSGLLVAAGGPAAGVIPSQVAALAAGVTRAMLLTKVKVATVILMTVSLLAGTAGILTHQVLAGKPLAPQATGEPWDRPSRQHTGKDPVASLQAAPREGSAQDVVVFRGCVLDPDGKRLAGAKLYLTLSWRHLKRAGESPVYATTATDGGFQFTVPKANFHKKSVVVVSTAQGFGPGWVEMSAQDKNENVVIQLVKDDVPITGQIVDLQGRPVSGATLNVLHVRAAPREDLAPWLEAIQAGQGPSGNVEREYLPRQLMSQEVLTLPRQVTTNTDGRFRLAGFGRDRLVTARIDGPTIASQELRILTRLGKSIQVSEPGRIYPNRTEYMTAVYHGAAFQHVAGPTRPVVGVIRDKDTGKPVAGLSVQSFALSGNPIHNNRLIRTTTDAQGRYRLVGMPKGEGNEIIVVPDPSQPYLPVRARVPNPLALGPITVDFQLKRGIWVEGRITDKDTGKPVRAMVEYFALRANPHLRDHLGFTSLLEIKSNTREDGTYRVVGLPGPGVLGVRCGAPYLLASERDDEDGTKKPQLSAAPHSPIPIEFCALAPIDPPENAESFQRDVSLDPGGTLTGTMLVPDDKPLAGARSYGLTGWDMWDGPPFATPSFTVHGFNPHRPRPVLFVHPEKKLVGVLQAPKDKNVPVRVRLGPGAAVMGRLVDADGRPRANIELHLAVQAEQNSWAPYFPGKFRTDQDGRFRLEALLPGRHFELDDGQGRALYFGDGLRPSETRNLGDVQMKAKAE